MNQAATVELPEHLAMLPCRHGPMLILRGDAYVSRSLALYGEYSEGEVSLFSMVVRPGDVVVEVGANIGSLTVPLGRMVGPTGRVIAFEPQRAIHTVLCANLAINGLENVWAERVALGRKTGEIKVPALSLNQRANFGGVATGGDGGETCPLSKLDAYGLKALRLLKIDVEGAEKTVLQGATLTIRRTRPFLYVENDRPAQSAALIATILDLGYRLWWHQVPLFSSRNFRGNSENVFGTATSFNMICVPKELDFPVRGLVEITSAEAPHPAA